MGASVSNMPGNPCRFFEFRSTNGGSFKAMLGYNFISKGGSFSAFEGIPVKMIG